MNNLTNERCIISSMLWNSIEHEHAMIGCMLYDTSHFTDSLQYGLFGVCAGAPHHKTHITGAPAAAVDVNIVWLEVQCFGLNNVCAAIKIKPNSCNR